MVDLYTVRQVQDLLKVDRITIYRMLQDGRLKGIKIGQQWRFPRNEVEKLVTGSISLPSDPESQAIDASLPTHCVQTIQNLYSDISTLPALVVDMEGSPLTRMSSPCQFCQLMIASPSGQNACKASWKQIANASGKGEHDFECHAGLHYYAAPIYDRGEQVGAFLTGQVYARSTDRENEFDRMNDLARKYSIEPVQLMNAVRLVMVLKADESSQAARWPELAAKAIHSILNERSGFIQRLQQIADLTQIN